VKAFQYREGFYSPRNDHGLRYLEESLRHRETNSANANMIWLSELEAAVPPTESVMLVFGCSRCCCGGRACLRSYYSTSASRER
jgi:hypothetical protein